jgi:hypothetical protein
MTNGSGVMISASWRVLLKFSSGQTEIFEQISDLSPLLRDDWENLAYRDYGAF